MNKITNDKTLGNVCDEKGNSTIEDARSDWGEVQKVLKASSKDTHSQMSQNSGMY